MKALQIFIFSVSVLAFTGCLKEVTPSDAITTGNLTDNPDGILNAVNGAYSLFKDNVEFNGVPDDGLMYLRQFYHLSDFASDDIACGQVTTDPFLLSFTGDHSPTQTNTRYFWYINYKIINNTNTVIEAASKATNPDAATQQLIGECYFLRAFCHFNLVRLFAKPYSHDPSAPGIVLRTSVADPAQKARSTVSEVYQAIIADAEKGAEMMGQQRGVQYASREAAWSLLSRAYLYMENNDKAIEYADKVIGSPRFALTNATTYQTLFANAVSGSETIFCIAHTQVDDKGKFGSIASMIFSDGNSGWGEEFASKSLRDTMAAHPEDVRWKYIVKLDNGSGGVALKNGIETYYISKFSFQGGSPTLSSPIMFRLAEIYLNRAEAKAKKNLTNDALDDVDMIRKNRGLEASLYNHALPAGSTALDVVLKERRIELAFEGHRMYDVYRNKRNLNRTYWGYHLRGLKETDINLAVQPTGYNNLITNWNSDRIIYYIPIDEIQSNKLCEQNK
ncbi:MAG: RagB/SusD family nutrient uptake outer membrane protein [Chitinophagaceae bacterium]|nr:RagB/SusD family nutrient uptake outer membrane protein [Chitinophagaceae bacterium]